MFPPTSLNHRLNHLGSGRSADRPLDDDALRSMLTTVRASGLPSVFSLPPGRTPWFVCHRRSSGLSGPTGCPPRDPLRSGSPQGADSVWEVVSCG
jgi:hypothetical protein